jgi:hypothetical protein
VPNFPAWRSAAAGGAPAPVSRILFLTNAAKALLFAQRSKPSQRNPHRFPSSMLSSPCMRTIFSFEARSARPTELQHHPPARLCPRAHPPERGSHHPSPTFSVRPQSFAHILWHPVAQKPPCNPFPRPGQVPKPTHSSRLRPLFPVRLGTASSGLVRLGTASTRKILSFAPVPDSPPPPRRSAQGPDFSQKPTNLTKTGKRSASSPG